jgi:ssRNA-specific RNase YbeY (16S rRNA maturation enzyme)
MINFNYETDFILDNETEISKWISEVILSESKKEGEINYIFCDDEYLHKINLEHLGHDTLTSLVLIILWETNFMAIFLFL